MALLGIPAATATFPGCYRLAVSLCNVATTRLLWLVEKVTGNITLKAITDKAIYFPAIKLLLQLLLIGCLPESDVEQLTGCKYWKLV